MPTPPSPPPFLVFVGRLEREEEERGGEEDDEPSFVSRRVANGVPRGYSLARLLCARHEDGLELKR